MKALTILNMEKTYDRTKEDIIEESRPRMVNSSNASHDDKAMSLMGGDVFSLCAQASNGLGFLPSVCMGEGFKKGSHGGISAL